MRRLLRLLFLGLPSLALMQAAPLSHASTTTVTPVAIEAMEKRLGMVEKEIAAERKELAEIGPRRVAAAMRARTRGRLLYKMLRAGLMPLGSGFQSFVDHAQRVERLKHAVKLDLEEEINLGNRARTLTASLDTLNDEKLEVEGKKQIFEAAKVAIDEEKRRRDAFERAFGTSVGPASPAPSLDGEIVVYGPSGKMTPESIDAGSFRARKGRLTFPVAGQAEVRATTKEGGPGVEIKAALGAAVRAAHAGRVAFADRYGTYGSLIILDHGDRCYTVSANLGTTDVRVGDEVSAGEKIGTVGDDGRGPSLYFEVRVANEKVPPASWLGL
jgi:murein hydrolase activator